MTRAEQYVILRLNGSGSREAAREVGFAQGRPSGQAHRLWRDVERMKRQPAACAWVRESVAELEAKLKVAKEKARACDVLDLVMEASDAV